MKDFGKSDDPAVQAQLNRLAKLSLPDGRIGLETIAALMDRLGNPHRNLPPVFHVAGTNGKGSVCAFLRAMLEADGKSVHVTTSPHLVRYNERIRVAGQLIKDAELAPLLEEVLDAGENLAPSFFEVTIAAAFLAFSRTPADACIVEVGLGGRFDATNILEKPAACAITALGIDHERFLLAPEDGVPQEPIARIAFEKAGILKPTVPYVTAPHLPKAEFEIAVQSGKAGALRSAIWSVEPSTGGFDFVSSLRSFKNLPLPALPGKHQCENAGLAIAMLQSALMPPDRDVIIEGLKNTRWPGRLQKLQSGPLVQNREIWLDGGHNSSAGSMLGEHFAGQKLHLVLGMLEAKDPRALIDPLGRSIASLTIVPIPGQETHPAEIFGNSAAAADNVASALAALPDDELPALIAGSLYLAGEVLKLNNELPN